MCTRARGLPLALLLLASGAAWGDPTPGRITIRLVEKKKLRLVRYTTGARDPGTVGLEGALEVTLANHDPAKTERLPKHDVHGLVFRPSGGGEPFVVLHSCQCVHDATSQKYEGFTLLPGMKHTFSLVEWGCGGGTWTPPPPGAYDVQYRSRQ